MAKLPAEQREVLVLVGVILAGAIRIMEILMAMTWYEVKSKTADGSLNHILCYQPRQVFENLEDQRKMGR